MNGFVIQGRAYDLIKWSVTVFIPAFLTFYNAIALEVHLPFPAKVTTVGVALTFFLGSLIGISSLNYRNSPTRFDGTAFVDPGAPTNNPTVMLKDPSATGEVLLKVREVEPTMPPTVPDEVEDDEEENPPTSGNQDTF